jgi:hypothetical protein
MAQVAARHLASLGVRVRVLLFAFRRIDRRVGRSRHIPAYLAGRKLGRAPGAGYASALLLLLAMGLLVVSTSYRAIVLTNHTDAAHAIVGADWNVQVVQQGDEFDYALGDNPYIHHKPSPTGGRTRPVLFVYSIATYPDGTKSREVMNIDQVKDIQKKSRARKGPWSDPIFFPEMCRKTVARLHSKQLPMSTDLDRLLHRDDALYDFTGARDQRQPIAPPQRPATVAAALDAFSGAPDIAAAAPKGLPSVPFAISVGRREISARLSARVW